MRASASTILIALTLGLVACGGEGGTAAKDAAPPAAAADVGETLATVNGMTIGSKEFEQAAARKAPANGESLSPEEKKEVIDGLVEEKLLYGEALRKGLDKDPKVQKVMVNTLLRDDVYSAVKNGDFTDEELQKYYDEHKDEFIVPEKVQIKRILVKVSETRSDDDAKKFADKLRAEVVKNPDSFKDVAARDSEDPYKRRGGDIGFVAKEGKPGIDQAVVDKAFSLETSAISEVFKTTEGYNIVQVAARREQVERTFQQMKGSVLRKVKNDKMKKLYDDYVAKLKTGASTQVDEAKLSALEVKNARRPFAAGAVVDEGEAGEAHEGGPAAAGVEGAPPMMVPGAPPALKVAPKEGK